MSNLSRIFKSKKPLITFITAGDPDLKTTENIVYQLEKSGADIVELGIPFSDSIADGHTIVESANRAISKHVDAKQILVLVKKIRKKTNIPIVFMTSYNILFKYGPKKFIDDASAAKVDGLILPDLTPEEAGDLLSYAKTKGVDIIFLIAPNTDEKRIETIAKISQGFIYLVSVTGITGVRREFPPNIQECIKKIRKYTKKPIALGFGISNPSQAHKAASVADGVIVGSALVNLIHQDLSKLDKFVYSLKEAIKDSY